MSLKLDWADTQQTRPVVLARRMDVGRMGGGLVLPGKTWRTPAGEGANYMFEGPSLQVRARVLARGSRGDAFQVFTDPKGSRGLGKIRLSTAARAQVTELEADLYRRICERDGKVRQCTWTGIQGDGHLDLDLLCEGESPYVALPDEGLGSIPERGMRAHVVMGLHRIVVNHSRGTARPVWVLLGVRKCPAGEGEEDEA